MLHLLKNTGGRRDQLHAEPRLWNDAGDAVINDEINACAEPGRQFPAAWKTITSASLGVPGNLLVEEVYELIKERRDQQQAAAEAARQAARRPPHPHRRATDRTAPAAYPRTTTPRSPYPMRTREG